ncbi:ATP-binding cassette domain-containing protein, partial [Rhizobium ruizarguesonis]
CHGDIGKAEARAETVRLLEKVRIPNAASRFDEYPHQISGGMRQRVMIAMALASRPKLLIADEPTTALDVITSCQILDLFVELQAETGVASLYISHDLALVSRTASRVAVIRRGEIVEQGAVRDIFANPKQDYTRELIAAVPDPARRLVGDIVVETDKPLVRVENVSGHIG